MFGRLLSFAIVIGLVLGFALPVRKSAAPTPPQQVAVVTPASPPPPPAYPTETILKRADNGHFYVDAEVNGQLVHFVVDTGAGITALTKADAQRVGIAFSPNEFTVIGRGASGDVRGQEVTINRLAIAQKEAWDIRAVVLDDGLDVSLLGQNYLSRIGKVEIAGDQMTLR
jgi:aspartyl protease family protein